MFGEKGLELVKEAARTHNNMVPFNEDIVRQTLEETKNLWDANRAEVAESSTVGPSTILRHAAIERNKRCLLAYLNHRVDKLRTMRWQFGAVLPEEIQMNLCEPEKEFFSKYNKALATYMRAVGTDITADNVPPKSLYIEVRVKQDHGEIETADGEVVLLKKGTQHHLPRELCEQLVMQGVLEHVIS